MGTHFHIVKQGHSPRSEVSDEHGFRIAGRVFVQKLAAPDGEWTCEWRNDPFPGGIPLGTRGIPDSQVRRLGKLEIGSGSYRLDLYEITTAVFQFYGHRYRPGSEFRAVSLFGVPYELTRSDITRGHGEVIAAHRSILVGPIRWNTVMSPAPV